MNALSDFQKISGNFTSLMKGHKHLSEMEESVEIAPTPKEIVWEDGKVKLYHFLGKAPKKVKTPVLISYALVNRWKMMDLQEDRTFIGRMLEEGLDVYLIDSGYPTIADRFKTIDDYVNGNIDDMVDFICDRHALDQINLLGVCQGGTMAMIYAALHPEKIKNLITMITPADFSIEDGLLFQWSKKMDIDKVVDSFNGVVPGQFLDMGFQWLKPMGKVQKAMNLPNMMEDKDRLINYLRMEKWVNDCPDQAGEIYRQFIKDLYQENKLIKNELKIGEEVVNLKNITMPLLNIYATADHIVPPSSSKPIPEAVGSKDTEVFEFPGGHIGIYVSGKSQKVLAPTIQQWLEKRD